MSTAKRRVFTREFEKSNPEPALVPWRKSRATMEKITAIYPEQIEWQIDLGAVLNRIGDVLRNAGEFQEALKVYERQLQLAEGVIARDPSNVLAQSNQGINKERVAWALFALGRIEDALPYFDESIQIKASLRQERNQKSEAFTYWERAIARIYAGRLEDAAQDLQNAIRLNPEEMYYPIWLHIVRSRLGVDDQRELAANVKDYDFSKWPGAIIALYLEQHDEAAVHNIALATEKDTDRADNVCASDLYRAIHQLAKGSQTEGRRLLQSAADHCAPGTFGRVTAGWELKRLEGLLPHWDDKSLALANCDRLAASNLDPQRPASIPGVPVSALKRVSRCPPARPL